MQVILQEDLHIGRTGTIVTVKGGYARNYLIPSGKAVKSTKQNQANFETVKKELEQKALERRQEAEKKAAELNNITLSLLARVVSTDKLFGAITNHQIIQAFSEKKIDLHKNQIQIDKAIRYLGKHQIQIVLHPDVTISIPLEVHAENPQEKHDRYATSSEKFTADSGDNMNEEADEEGPVAEDDTEDDTASPDTNTKPEQNNPEVSEENPTSTES
jgi:large subunit ribosomal protein L9